MAGRGRWEGEDKTEDGDFVATVEWALFGAYYHTSTTSTTRLLALSLLCSGIIGGDTMRLAPVGEVHPLKKRAWAVGRSKR